ncbi:EscV/YscV/HrcV family type III secretion system export apparatus protein [Citrobacter sp. wls826]|uniref:EscV/YscV/HrcV family type III secretion system export apparatus protein n=1 Tax=Citrobacter sp. wls826 TaxID=2576415 RepID=UPI0010C9AA53|nr:EscV/YscV/HrcV family type III secretion system export apparatus protein [Citrobacter sp. wls826]TKU24775.1 EscV/YscV/HrcV family type III secretion system export apparatus protein [Citrobacter sp. wls826]TKV30100.1 EscV/YscV/HrcV family type III secretion system export apparatus protein [Citrobacter sp. TBCS-11]
MKHYNLKFKAELFILLLMIVIIAMLIIPLPTYIIDFLIALNLIIALLIFMGSFYIERILDFSTFPAILLITTLFRLAISISTSRLVLIEADAGDIISSFGEFVIGDSLIVGFVIFSIVTIVQFIVITKGSERVAEVAARFSLDGMPGKQMSIDADMRAGMINADEARERRSVLERESQLYGSFDGAMKFIKGDAIAGIIIIFVNLIGGISVGITQYDMDVSTALSTYTVLTIGDGLVAQIPALLISISAGFIVTKVNGESDNMGRTVINQLVRNPFVLLVTSILAICMGLLPGFPLIVFLMLAGGVGTIYFFKTTIEKKALTQNGNLSYVNLKEDNIDTNIINDNLELINNIDNVVINVTPLMIGFSPETFEYFSDKCVSDKIRSQFLIDYGIRLPEITITTIKGLEKNMATLYVNEVDLAKIEIYCELMRVVSFSEKLVAPNVNFTYGKNKEMWVSKDKAHDLSVLGIALRSPLDELYQCASISILRNISEVFGIQETKFLMDSCESQYPDLVHEVFRYITMQRIAEVLQRLLNERVSVRNIRLIMEALALWAPREKDIIILVEQIRGFMSRYICQRFLQNNILNVIMLSGECEEQFRKSIRQVSSGAMLNMSPSEADALIDKFTVGFEGYDVKNFVILCSVDVRRYVKKFLETKYQDIGVISFGEINDNISINIIKTI